MRELRLSEQTRADFYDIAAFGSERYGPAAASDYVDSFGETFDLICRHPQIGRPRDEIAPGLRSRRHQSHIVYYVLPDEAVLIARVLHARQDPESVFREG